MTEICSVRLSSFHKHIFDKTPKTLIFYFYATAEPQRAKKVTHQQRTKIRLDPPNHRSGERNTASFRRIASIIVRVLYVFYIELLIFRENTYLQYFCIIDNNWKGKKKVQRSRNRDILYVGRVSAEIFWNITSFIIEYVFSSFAKCDVLYKKKKKMHVQRFFCIFRFLESVLMFLAYVCQNVHAMAYLQ